ncbi:dihydrofolate reductase family protein [Streptomyces sp. NPDC047000]|uniref:dihydrofolate reductase family protein n=1 Tax=Streptomyces sp. NPDC047000 TaxID=3155474 RepID=UPI0033E421F5
MGKIVLVMSVSLDGYVEGPGRDISWHRVDEELHQHMNDLLRPMGAFLNGRVTHELMTSFWPTADADPEASPTMAEYAGIWREKPKYVYSRTLPEGPAEWNTTVVREVVPEEVRALADRPGEGDIALAGADLITSFLRHDLIDEFRVYVHPVLIGAGTPLFPRPGTPALVPLHLVESRTFGNGVTLLHHRRG